MCKKFGYGIGVEKFYIENLAGKNGQTVVFPHLCVDFVLLGVTSDGFEKREP